MSGSESGAWRSLPDSFLAALTISVGQSTLRFTGYRIRTRQRPESLEGILTRLLLHDGIVAIEGQRYRAEYVVRGWRSGSGQQVEVEVIPLSWEDHGDRSISTREIGSLTRAVVAAHELVTSLVSDLVEVPNGY